MRFMILVLSLVLGVVPLAGVAWVFSSDMITLSPPSATTDGLFMTLILLTLTACFLMNAFWEARDLGLIGKKRVAAAKAPTAKAS
jgi:cytochrome c biogenesis factor